MAVSHYALISEAERHAVTNCPKCGGADIKGPHDTGRSATFLFTRAYFCRTCWWDKEIRMEDDVAAHAHKEAVKAKKKADEAARKEKRRVA